MTTSEKRQLHENAALLLLEIEEQENYMRVCTEHLEKDESNFYQTGYNRALAIRDDKEAKYKEILSKLI